ncbi:MAG: U32 family peptidase [bacterium]
MRIVATLERRDEMARLEAAGADVMLVSVPDFSAGVRTVFHPEELAAVCFGAAARNISVYIDVSAPIHEAMLADLERAMTLWDTRGAAAFVCADISAVAVAIRLGLAHKTIYQPGTFNANLYAPWFYKRQGLRGITVSREITLEDIVAISINHEGLEISIIGHGHLPMFHSRRQFLSDYQEYRGTELTGAEGCQNWFLEERERPGRRFPIVEDATGTMLFRDYKLQSFDETAILAPYIADFFVSRRFIADDEYEAALAAYAGRGDAKAFLARYGPTYDSGFHYRKTGLSKEGEGR